MTKYRLPVLTPHPIQYQAPMHGAPAADAAIDLTVSFSSDSGVKPYHGERFQERNGACGLFRRGRCIGASVILRTLGAGGK